MSKPAALPLFGDAYLADTTHLTTEEHGAYLLLMIAAWRQPDCALPLEDRKLARIAGLSVKKWASIRDTILEFWTVEGGRIFHTGKCTQTPVRPTFSPAFRQKIFQRDGGCCVYCGALNGPFHLDHVFPFSRGGSSDQENIVLACEPCNRAKSDRTPEEMGWLQ